MTNRQHLLIWATDTLRQAAWAPLSVLGIYGLGLIFHAFQLFPSLDMPVHFLGGVAITYFYRAALRHSQKSVGAIPRPIEILCALTCTGTTAVLWEFFENIVDFFARTHMVRGLQDTLMDLLMGLSGAFVFSLLYRSQR